MPHYSLENTSHFGQTRKIDLKDLNANARINENNLVSPIQNLNNLSQKEEEKSFGGSQEMLSPKHQDDNNVSVMEFDTIDAFDDNREEKDFVSPLIKKHDLNDDEEIQITAIKKAPCFIMSDQI